MAPEQGNNTDLANCNQQRQSSGQGLEGLLWQGLCDNCRGSVCLPVKWSRELRQMIHWPVRHPRLNSWLAVRMGTRKSRPLVWTKALLVAFWMLLPACRMLDSASMAMVGDKMQTRLGAPGEAITRHTCWDNSALGLMLDKLLGKLIVCYFTDLTNSTQFVTEQKWSC